MESGSVWARLHPNMTSWPKLGSDGGGPGPSWAQSNLMRHAENLPFYRYFQRFLALMGVRAKPCCPHWACLGPNFGARCPLYRTKLRTQSQTCVQACPSGAMFSPSWAGPLLSSLSNSLGACGSRQEAAQSKFLQIYRKRITYASLYSHRMM